MRILLLVIFWGFFLFASFEQSASAKSWDGGGGTNLWSTDNNWTGNSRPMFEDVILGDISNQFTRVDDSFAINSLTLTNTASFATDENVTLLVDGPTILNENSVILLIPEKGFGFVALSTNGLSLAADTRVDLLGGAGIALTGGTLRLNERSGAAEGAAKIQGTGSISINEITGPAQFINDGIIQPELGRIAINYLGIRTVGIVDLDGASGNGVLDVDDGSSTRVELMVNSPLSDPTFNGTISVGDNDFVSIREDWSLGSGGVLQFNTAGGSAAESMTFETGINSEFTQTGGTITVQSEAIVEFKAATNFSGGTFDLGAGSQVVMQRPVTIGAGSDIQMASNVSLRFEETVDFSGAGITGAGHIVFAADLAIAPGASATIAPDLDWDGDAEVTNTLAPRANTSIGSGAMLTLNGQIDDDYDGNLTLDNGTLNVANDRWTHRGDLNLSNGSEILGREVTIRGDVNIEGINTIEAPSKFGAEASVVVNSGDRLELNGETIFEGGGSYRGAGTIRQEGNLVVRGDTIIGTNFSVTPGSQFWLNTYDLDGTSGETEINIHPNADLVINAVAIDTNAADGFDGTITTAGGNLIVNTGVRLANMEFPGVPLPATVFPSAWRLDGTLNLVQAFDDIPVVTSTVGSPLEIRGTVHAQLGESIVSPALTTFTSGLIRVNRHATLRVGALEVNGGVFQIEGTINLEETSFNTGTDVQIDAGGTANLTGMTNLNAGSYSGEGDLRFQSATSVFGNVTLDVRTTFESTSQTTIIAGVNLSLGREAIVTAGAIIDGPSELRNLAASTLVLRQDAVIAAEVVNQGTLRLDNASTATAQASMTNYQQTSTGSFVVDLLGTTKGSFDRLLVSGNVDLAGGLEVFLLEGFMPVEGDFFEILTADSGVSGMFDAEMLPALNAGLAWNVNYETNAVLLEVILPGDYNDDGSVDAADYTVWRDNVGAPAGTLLNDPSGLVIGSIQYDNWVANFGATASSSTATSSVPEPTSLMLALLLLGVHVGRSRSFR